MWDYRRCHRIEGNARILGVSATQHRISRRMASIWGSCMRMQCLPFRIPATLCFFKIMWSFWFRMVRCSRLYISWRSGAIRFLTITGSQNCDAFRISDSCWPINQVPAYTKNSSNMPYSMTLCYSPSPCRFTRYSNWNLGSGTRQLARHLSCWNSKNRAWK